MFSIIKRLIDIAVSIAGLTLLAAPFLVIFLAIRLSSQGPAIYLSTRVGQNSEPFVMPKFRTMKMTTPEVPTEELKDPHMHITVVGRFLRKFSLDELPQLYSVLIGTMSLVGPRPMIPQLTEIIEERKRNGVDQLKPGITGWAQVNGRDNLSMHRKLALEVEYLEKSSILFDIWIMLLTVVHVFRSKGVAH